MFRISEESKARHARHRVYDSADISTTGAASVSVGTEIEGSVASDREDMVESSDEEGEDDGEERINPLQSGAQDQEGSSEHVSEEGPEAAAEELARLEVSQDAPSAAEPEEQTPTGDAEAEDEDDEEPAPSTRPETPSTTSQAQQPKRGQRGKAKKMAAKYKHQDSEDRALMEELLGVAAARQKAEAAAALKAQQEADAAAAQERRRAAQERAKKQIAAHEEKRRAMLEEGGDVVEDEDAGALDLGPLDALVGTPLPGDEILEVVPVCAPWGALGRVKYKAKLQPGQVKKGKAVKEIVERWKIAGAQGGKKGWVDEKSEDPEKMWPRELVLIKGLKVEEAYNVVPVGKVTVMMSGGGSGGGGSGGKGGKGGGGGPKGGKGKGGKKR
jgi:hypothetical protein